MVSMLIVRSTYSPWLLDHRAIDVSGEADATTDVAVAYVLGEPTWPSTSC